MNSRYQVLDSGFQSLSGFWTPWAEFRILKPRIPESTGKNWHIPESGFPYKGRSYHLLNPFYKNEYQDLEVPELFLLKPKKASYMLSAINVKKICVLWFRALNCLLKLSHHEFPTSFPNVRVHFVLFIVSVGEYCSGSHKSSATTIFHRGILKQQLRCSRSGDGDE